MVRKLFRVGHSVCITLDKKMLNSLGMDGITWLWVEPDKNKKQIVIRQRTDKDW